MASFALRVSPSARVAAFSRTCHVYTGCMHTCLSLDSPPLSVSLPSSSLSLNSLSLTSSSRSAHTSHFFFGNFHPSSLSLHSVRFSPSSRSPRFSVVVSEQSVLELPPKLQKIVQGFQSVPDPRARYQQLLYYGAQLKPLAKDKCVPENKVVGCVSQVWVFPVLREDGNVYFEAESDSALTKGLAALLVEGLSGAKPSEILNVTPDFVTMLGLNQSLTPSRNNGFLNMLKLMQKRTMEIYMQSQAQSGGREVVLEAVEDSAEKGAENVMTNGTVPDNGSPSSSSNDNNSSGLEGAEDERPIYNGIKRKLEKELKATLEIDDVSHQHAGHAGVHKGATETHFNVKVISEAFEGLNTVKRHRLVYGLLSEEFQRGLHALSLVTKTPSEAGVA